MVFREVDVPKAPMPDNNRLFGVGYALTRKNEKGGSDFNRPISQDEHHREGRNITYLNIFSTQPPLLAFIPYLVE